MGEDKEERKLTVREVRVTIAASLAAAFGFVIALVWKEVVMSGFALAGIDLGTTPDLTGWIYFMITALILTFVMIILIILISRWGGKE
ncbi:MAG: DUF5654 family protein [Thermoplasmata archaeon]|jgi:hypothetical protein